MHDKLLFCYCVTLRNVKDLPLRISRFSVIELTYSSLLSANDITEVYQIDAVVLKFNVIALKSS